MDYTLIKERKESLLSRLVHLLGITHHFPSTYTRNPYRANINLVRAVVLGCEDQISKLEIAMYLLKEEKAVFLAEYERLMVIQNTVQAMAGEDEEEGDEEASTEEEGSVDGFETPDDQPTCKSMPARPSKRSRD